MEILHSVLVVVHLLGMAAIIGGWLVARAGRAGEASESTVTLSPIVWGARLQIISGLLLVGLAEMGTDPVNHAKIGVKLVVAIAVAACVEIANARAKRGTPAPGLLDAGAGLAIVNVLVAVFW